MRTWLRYTGIGIWHWILADVQSSVKAGSFWSNYNSTFDLNVSGNYKQRCKPTVNIGYTAMQSNTNTFTSQIYSGWRRIFTANVSLQYNDYTNNYVISTSNLSL